MPEIKVQLNDSEFTFDVPHCGDEEDARLAAEAIACRVFQDGSGAARILSDPAVDAVYDTLDDFPPGEVGSVEDINRLMLEPLKGTVGTIISGGCGLSDPSVGYWGRALCLSTDEHIQIRHYPRGSLGRPLRLEESRMIAVRRTGPKAVPTVSMAIAFLPRSCVTGGKNLPLSSARSSGCRGVHLVLPSLYNKHDPSRDQSRGHADLDVRGFHSIRPSVINVAKATAHTTTDGMRANVKWQLCPGNAYLVMAAHTMGVDQADPITRSFQDMKDNEHVMSVAAITRRMSTARGEDLAVEHVSSALTITELLGAEGIMGFLCNSFFDGTLPDMLHSPIGMPFLIVMATRIACYAEHFGTEDLTTQQDRFANAEMLSSFNSRWAPLRAGSEQRAIDFVIERALASAGANACKKKDMLLCIKDNVSFWRAVGQRVVTRAFSDPAEHRGREDLKTPFGRADLVDDPLTAAKYAFLSRRELAQPIKEAPINRIHLAPKTDLHITLLRIHDSVEHFLRTGMYGEVSLSSPNESRDTDEQIDAQLEEYSDAVCIDAVSSGTGAACVALLHGAFAFHQLGIGCYLVGDGCSVQCADCDRRVTPLQGVLLNSRIGECVSCNRPRCLTCTEVYCRVHPCPPRVCRRCSGPHAESPRKNLPKSRKKK